MTTPGKRIKAIRNSIELSVDDVAERSGVNKEIIINCEEKNIIPPLPTLIKIAHSINSRIGNLFDSSEPERPKVISSENSGQSKPVISLSGNKSARYMEPMLINLYPTKDSPDKSGNGSTADDCQGELFLFVTDGSVKLEYGNETYILNQGDSIYIDSAVPHSFYSDRDTPSQILAVYYSPQ